MIKDEHIDAAVAEGVFSAEQAARLRAIAGGDVAAVADDVALTPEVASDPDDEKFRLIGGFNDVFVTIGVGLLIAALFGLASVLELRVGFAALAMVFAWGLSEFFSRRMRLALPSIALALMFAGAAGYVGFLIAEFLFRGSAPLSDSAAGLWLVFSGAAAVFAALAHEWRFRVPIDIAIAATGMLWLCGGLLTLVAPAWTNEHWSLLFGVLGLAVFALALRYDASDPARRTRRADIAFWLHLLAAPMIVHAVIPLVTGHIGEMGPGQAIGILAIFALLGLVAIVIDRRALLVSGLTYAGVAIGYLLSQSVEEGMGLSLTLLLLAALVLGLSAGWRPIRRAILPLLPLGSLQRSIPPA